MIVKVKLNVKKVKVKLNVKESESKVKCERNVKVSVLHLHPEAADS